MSKQALLDFGREIMSRWRNSALLNILAGAIAPSIRSRPIHQCPGWKARLCGIKVPSIVRPHDTPKPEGSANINIILSLLDEVLDLDGDVCECGVFRGSTLIPIGLHIAQHNSPKRLFGLDSFQGFGDDVTIDINLGGPNCEARKVNGMNTTSHRYVARRVELLGLSSMTELLPGYFENTLSALADRQFSFVHLDCDLYQSYRTCLEFFYPRMSPGGIILFDEYNDSFWPGCNVAVDEFFADKAEKPVPIMRDNYIKCYIQKRAASAVLPDLSEWKVAA